jgi:hypothetical protein
MLARNSSAFYAASAELVIEEPLLVYLSLP